MDSSSSSSWPSSNDAEKKTEILDAPLHAFGFKIGDLSATRVTGRLPVTAKCCQPFKVLHGGVSALIAEALASAGAGIASGFKRVAGIHLSIHHLRPAAIGDCIFAEASPVSIGNTIQVWEVRLWKTDESDRTEKRSLVSSSRVTLFCNLRVPEHSKDAPDNLRKFVSKL